MPLNTPVGNAKMLERMLILADNKINTKVEAGVKTKTVERWRQHAKKLKREVYALYFAYRDPRVPWFAKVFIACIVAYAFSPVDLIPDFIPVLGYLDDLVIIPLAVTLALKMIPQYVLDQSREKADALQGKPKNWIAAVVFIAIWIALALIAIKCLVNMSS